MLTFRGLLESREKQGDTELFSALNRMWKQAEGSWLSQLGSDDYASYTGIPHIRGVESNLDEAVPSQLKEAFSSTEIFILLAAVLCHDIGKLWKPTSNQSQNKKSFYHGWRSCTYIQEHGFNLQIPRKDLVKGIAALSCAHVWPSPFPNFGSGVECGFSANGCFLRCAKGKFSELDANMDSFDGPIRLRWMASLLRIADEVDNHLRRAVPDNLPVNQESIKAERSWRSHITRIVFDAAGKCIRLHTPNYEEWLQKEKQYVQTGALHSIDVVLKKWKDPLNEMGLDFQQAFIEASLPYPILIPSADSFVDDKHLVFTCEPVLDEDIILGVRKAIDRLNNAVLGKDDFFTWEALAEESHINNVSLVRIATNRVASLQKWPQDKIRTKDPAPLDVQITDAGWRKNAETNTNHVKIEYIGSGERTIPSLPVLNDLLSPDIEKEQPRGFCARPVKDGQWLPPIIAVEGSSGDGKSTLSLQIACTLASETWACLYYSLEQEQERVVEILKGHDWFKIRNKDKSKIAFETFQNTGWREINNIYARLLLPRLTPRPVADTDSAAQSFFETRYDEIRHSLAWTCGNHKKESFPKCFYILDSLTAFSYRPLSREQIHRLFGLFREYSVPLLVTLERQRQWVDSKEEDNFNVARYLADIVINLDTQNTSDYFRQTIEVTKTRFSRRVLGKHLMKIKSTGQKSSGQFDKRVGVVIYPSVHLHLVNSRFDRAEKEHDKKPQQIFGFNNDQLPIFQSFHVGNKKIHGLHSGTCIVLSGASGGHKLALALNILMSTRVHKYATGYKLIISMAEESEIQLDSVALFESEYAKEIREHLTRMKTGRTEKGAKVLLETFGKVGDSNSTGTILNFRLGQIMPEEFLYILESYLDTVKIPVDTILFSDTAQLRTRFPLLQKEELFLPALIDIMKSRKITSIFIDVCDEHGHPNEALLASADCRLFIGKEELREGIDRPPLNTLQVDNVLGKYYDRNLRYFGVKQKTSELIIDKDKEIVANKVKGD